ncbi:uncharacterized protein LOC110027037, partial [Phalaenopsis equestris]|uniref:uncharacterized protein LOC110027037 n=1 Tax=Phalaenopsis equestris TaxID=78828 RepID=UPI0009E65C36
MKILDWMHRKLQPATKYSRVSHTNAPAFEHDAVDRIDPAHHHAAVGTEPDSETPLLLHVNLAGILTIGTLGYSHPLFLPHAPEEPTLDLPEKDIQAAAKLPTRIALTPPVTESLVMKTEHSAVKVHAAEEKIMAEPLLKEDMERKERTTLGDLLAIERAVNWCDQPPAVTGSTSKSTSASDLKKGGKEKRKKGGELELS